MIIDKYAPKLLGENTFSVSAPWSYKFYHVFQVLTQVTAPENESELAQSVELKKKKRNLFKHILLKHPLA